MKDLRSLRHLYLKGCYGIRAMPPKFGQLTHLKTLSLFVVGKSKGCWLAELQHLDLGGELCLVHLEKVRNAEDAKEANLVGKQNLRLLGLSWGSNNESESSQANVEQILEALEPHPNVKALTIKNYSSPRFPIWMSSSIFTNIVTIRLIGCRNCLLLPGFGKLPLLRSLHIGRMDYVEYIDNDFPAGGPVRGFPSLEVLEIFGLPNLKGLSREEGRDLLPRLRELNIRNCPKLTFPHLSSPESLYCGDLVLSSISNLNHLISLTVGRNDDVISFPEEMLLNLTALESLRIEDCRKLQMLPTNLVSLVSLKLLCITKCRVLESLPDHELQSLRSIRELEIKDCDYLRSLPDSLGHLTALEKLSVNGCPRLEALPESIKHLNFLQHLTISGKPSAIDLSYPIFRVKLKTLPEVLQHIPALQSLCISSYPELTSLPEWLGNLTSLRLLSIRYCPEILSLPESIRSLKNLQTLDIWGCSLDLLRRCEEGKGEDWHKIAHIPQVFSTTDRFLLLTELRMREYAA